MRTVFLLVFLFYFFLLLQLTIFKGWFFFAFVPAGSFYKAHTQNASFYYCNLVPFRTIASFLFSKISLEVKCSNLLGNVLLFVPFGWLLPRLFNAANRIGFILPATFSISLVFELYQFFSHTGNGDIDDVILNTVGGFLGYQVFKRWKSKDPQPT